MVCCPTLVVDTFSLPEIGHQVHAAGTYSNDSRIWFFDALGNFYVYTYPGLVHVVTRTATSPNTGNAAVTEAGIAYYFGFATLGGSSFFDLRRINLATGSTTTGLWNETDDGRRFTGPSHNPHDGRIYFGRLNHGGTGYWVRAYWPLISAVVGIDDVGADLGTITGASDSFGFTDDGAVWWLIQGPGPASTIRLYRYDPDAAASAFVQLSTGSLTGHGADAMVPNLATVLYHDWVAVAAARRKADLTLAGAGCSLFGTGATARVSTSATGRSTFLYPTSGGLGRYVYTLHCPARWAVGRII